jgi:hypothetical protein
LRFQGITAGYKKQLIELKINKQNCSLLAKMQAVIPNRRGPDCFICCGGKDIEGFCEEVSSIYFPKWETIKSYTNHYSRTLSAGSSILLEQSTKVLLQSQINSEKFLNGIISYVCTAKQKLTN